MLLTYEGELTDGTSFRSHSFFIQWQILMKTSFDVGGLSFLRVNAMALVGRYLE